MGLRDEPVPIAIVGLGCRFPGGASSGEKFWDLLMNKRSARRDVPPDRFNVDSFYHPDGDKRGTMNVRAGHFLEEDMAAFDARFFSISPAEAVSMDPMQRMLLEVVYEAIENSGTPMSQFAGTNTGCYVGCFTNDYDQIAKKDAETLPKYHSVGTGQSILANRISFCFDLQGPSLTVDTACSSSLVALHMACQAIQSGETKAAIVGATQATLFPDMMVGMTNLHFLSPDGISYSFDSRANGYARGEGMAALVLKPLSDAIQDGDTIRAVIRGTAVNSNGNNTGITMPMRNAQARLIRQAYQQAGLDFMQTGYIEAHGTGTPLGDPIEAAAIGETLGSVRPEGEDGKLYMGSVKSNIGHLEGASGLAGMIKAVLSLEKGIIAPNVWFEKGNQNIDFDRWNLRVPTEPTPWPTPGLRRASVNSFGYGGTNAHVILDDARHYMEERGLCGKHRTSPSPLGKDIMAAVGDSLTSSSLSSDGDMCSSGDFTPGSSIPDLETVSQKLGPLSRHRPRIFRLCGHEAAAVLRNATLLRHHVSSKVVRDEQEFLDDLAFTMCERRSTLDFGAYIVASTREELVEGLKDLDLALGRRKEVPSLSFIFTGQGAQWWAMGRELMQYPVFGKTIMACDDTVRLLGSSWSLHEELLVKSEKESRINEAEISQPLCTALQIALVDLYASWNIRPDRVVGHSSGEIAAAYATGALSLESAMRVAYFRGLLSPMIQELGFRGGMLAAGISAEEADTKLQSMGNDKGKISVACINSPQSITFSGDIRAIDEMQKMLTGEKMFARKLQVQTAYHSHHMHSIADEYLARLGNLDVTPWEERANVTMFSSVKPGAVDSGDDLGAEYWVRNMVSSVLFSDALAGLCNDKTSGKQADILVEIGPHSALAGPVKQILARLPKRDTPIQYLSALVRERKTDGKGAAVSCLTAAASLDSLGYPIDLRAANFGLDAAVSSLSVLTDLPTYSWNHSAKYWSESRLSRDYRFRPFPRTDLLGAPVSDWNPLQPRWRNFIRLAEQPWVAGHKVQGAVAYPAAGFCCMAIEAAAQLHLLDTRARIERGEAGRVVEEYRLSNVQVIRALIVPSSEEGVEVSFCMTPEENVDLASQIPFRVFSYTDDAGWSEHCRGTVLTVYKDGGEDEAQAALKTDEEYRMALKHATAVCETPVAASQIYDSFARVGLGYGPDFQGIREVASGERAGTQAVGVVEVTDTASSMPKGFAFERLVHPATMDALLQMSIVAFASGDAGNIARPYVPTFIKEVSVRGDIQAPAGQEMRVVATAQPHGSRKFHADVTALTEGGTKAAVKMSGIELVSLALSPEEETGLLDAKKICATVSWQPDVDLLDVKSMGLLLDASVGGSYDYEGLRDRELLGHYYFDQVMKTIDDEAEYGSMLPHHQKFFRYMQYHRRMVQSGTHEFYTAEWADLSAPHVVDKICSIEATLERASDAEGQMFLRMGRALASVLRQEVDALALMMKDNLLFDYYHSAPGSQGTYPKVARYLELLSHKYPDLEYLEIGAGTGGLTKPVLEALSGCGNRRYARCKSYTYTDISTGFFEQAAGKFKDSAQILDFKKLDIEQDPSLQAGFDDGKLYDVVLAANVLHATRDMNRTMRHVRKLLRPGGKLILLELTRDSIVTSLIFGNLPGWWASEEPWRVNGPLLSECQWQTVCRDTGFSDFEVCSPDTPDLLLHQAHVMVASAVPQNLQINGGISATTNHRTIVITPFSPDDSSTSTADHLLVSQAISRLSAGSGFTVDTCTLEEARTRDFSGVPVVSLVELTEPVLASPSAEVLTTLQRMVRESVGFIWVTRGGVSFEATRPEMAIAQGLLRSVRHENEHLAVVSLDLSAAPALPDQEAADLIARVFEQNFGHELKQHQLLGKTDAEICEHHGLLHIKRAIENPRLDQLIAAKVHGTALTAEPQDVTKMECPLRLRVETLGDLSSIVFGEDEAFSQKPLAEKEVSIQVKSIGLNLRDAMVCTGDVAEDHMQLGNDCAGVVTQVGAAVQDLAVGDRVATWCLGSYATVVRSHEQLVHKIPTEMSFATAASLPTAYATAYYSLVKTAGIQKRDSVLIQGAAEAAGQAAIHIAKTVGCCNIFATVGTEDQMKQLIELHGLPDSHVFVLGDSALVGAIRGATNGRGVTVLLESNSMVDRDAVKTGLQAVAPFGRIVALGEAHDTCTQLLELAASSLRNVTVTAVDMLAVLRQGADLAGEVFSEAMNIVLGENGPPPMPLSIQPLSKIPVSMDSIRNLRGEHVKTVFEPRAGDLVQVKVCVKLVPRRLDTVSLHADGSYLLVGGFGGIGRSLALWMVGHGARNLIIVSRRGASSPKAAKTLSELEALDAHVTLLQCDAADEERLTQLLRDALTGMPPLRGVINSAMDLRDQVFTNMSHEMFVAGLRPKVQGSWALHKATLDQPLDFFIMLSSAGGFFGSIAQANYVAACTYQVALAAHRRALGLPAVSIDVSKIVEVGHVAEDETGISNRNVTQLGMVEVLPEELYCVLEMAMRSSARDQDMSTDGDKDMPNGHLLTGVHSTNDPDRGEELPFWGRDPVFSHMDFVRPHLRRSKTGAGAGSSTTQRSLPESLAAAGSPEEAESHLLDGLVRKLARSLMMAVEDVDPAREMGHYGVDSLVAVDLRNWLARDAGVDMPVFEILRPVPLKVLVKKAVVQSTLVKLQS
ncbi:Lovastatin nonaketide synthase-like protein [Hapsidospora chrysogenum ATCC 11550]|uniref:Lovastatin nonaketide synthase-like protein n=1 Tax=Hapsidospora chrysogenum (strain ATCC 11550 / CBS 779.69 / DSM 880 / IAM 14645 / JCM 23072 / IMI 49137) TaxID=857340 RepID=A0A086SW53_HAPC1|nr:Lovastatin nonaketide synthase-like protein [Hapsidospora chrysogenum ATCC 11550]